MRTPIRFYAFLRTVLVLVVMSGGLYVSDTFSQTTEAGPIRSSPAYSEVLLRKTELKADLEALSADYTEANPKIVDLRFELSVIDKLLEKIFGVKPSETGKLTLALGKLIVRQAALQTDHARLLRSYSKDHPEVKRAARKMEIYDAAIKEVLR
jgi:hypothetical protein